MWSENYNVPTHLVFHVSVPTLTIQYYTVCSLSVSGCLSLVAHELNCQGPWLVKHKFTLIESPHWHLFNKTHIFGVVCLRLSAYTSVISSIHANVHCSWPQILQELCLNGKINQSGLTETMQMQLCGTDGARCNALCVCVCVSSRSNLCDLDSGKQRTFSSVDS